MLQENNINPNMRVFLKGNIYNDPALDKMLERPVLEHVGITQHESGYDEEWGSRWVVRTEEGDLDMSEQDLSPIPELVPVTTGRGFGVRPFLDMYASACSVQESSLATDDALWLGVNDNRMHLSRGQVVALLPLLQHFALTGMLPKGSVLP